MSPRQVSCSQVESEDWTKTEIWEFFIEMMIKETVPWQEYLCSRYDCTECEAQDQIPKLPIRREDIGWVLLKPREKIEKILL